MIRALALAATLGACGDNAAPSAPAIRIVTGYEWTVEYTLGVEVWNPVGFELAGALELEVCPRDWYELGLSGCELRIELARESYLVERYGARALADRARRQIVIDARYTGPELVHLVAHEVGHVALDAGHLERGRVGVMMAGGNETELTGADLELACHEVSLCRAH